MDSNGKLDTSILPAIAISDTFVVASEAAMLALTAQVGDIAVRTDLSKSFILKAAGASTLANWQELLTPADSVSSVNGETGTVVLDANDVGALPDSTKYGASLSVSGRSVQLKDQDGNNLGSAIQTQDTTYSAATQSANGLMSSTDKTKLDGISTGANKVEASTTNGNIKIDGVETTVYTLPAIDQVVETTFAATDWVESSGVFTLTITSTKRPFACFKLVSGTYKQVMVTLTYTGSSIVVISDDDFAGKLLSI